MTLTWNVVTKNLEPTGFLLTKLRQKIAKLEKHLVHFPPDAVHLQIHLEKHPRKTLFITSEHSRGQLATILNGLRSDHEWWWSWR